MGLLGKAIAKNNMDLAANAALSASAAPADIESIIVNFHRKSPAFHCIVLQGLVPDGMIACHGAKCVELPGRNTLTLLPGALDRELFAHRLSRSTGSAVLIQFDANAPSLALETLNPYLQ